MYHFDQCHHRKIQYTRLLCLPLIMLAGTIARVEESEVVQDMENVSKMKSCRRTKFFISVYLNMVYIIMDNICTMKIINRVYNFSGGCPPILNHSSSTNLPSVSSPAPSKCSRKNSINSTSSPSFVVYALTYPDYFYLHDRIHHRHQQHCRVLCFSRHLDLLVWASLDSQVGN